MRQLDQIKKDIKGIETIGDITNYRRKLMKH